MNEIKECVCVFITVCCVSASRTLLCCWTCRMCADARGGTICCLDSGAFHHGGPEGEQPPTTPSCVSLHQLTRASSASRG